MAKTHEPWYRMDSAGVLYSSLQSEKYSATYRFSALMKEKVDPEALQRAVNRTMPRFPGFGVRIRRGRVPGRNRGEFKPGVDDHGQPGRLGFQFQPKAQLRARDGRDAPAVHRQRAQALFGLFVTSDDRAGGVGVEHEQRHAQ